MAHVIKANTWFTKRYLKVHEWGIEFMETAALGGKHKVDFGGIEYVLMSRSNVLSIQCGHDIYSIPVKPQAPKHQAALAALLEGVHRHARAFPVQPIVEQPWSQAVPPQPPASV